MVENIYIVKKTHTLKIRVKKIKEIFRLPRRLVGLFRGGFIRNCFILK